MYSFFRPQVVSLLLDSPETNAAWTQIRRKLGVSVLLQGVVKDVFHGFTLYFLTQIHSWYRSYPPTYILTARHSRRVFLSFSILGQFLWLILTWPDTSTIFFQIISSQFNTSYHAHEVGFGTVPVTGLMESPYTCIRPPNERIASFYDQVLPCLSFRRWCCRV